MWPSILEWCADILAGTNRKHRLLHAAIAFGGAFSLAVFCLVRWGLQGLLPLGLVLGLGFAAARDVFAARDRLWRAAVLPLEHSRQPPVCNGDDTFAAPTAVALNRLALAMNAARRGRAVEANELLPGVARDRLRPEELALLEAVRSLVCLSLGDVRRAAQIAAGVLPTGAQDIDTALGRAIVADAWGDRERLLAVDSAWSEAGVESAGDGTLPRLRRLARLRIDGSVLEQVAPAEASALSEEARAIGDDELATELGFVARRSGTYR